MIVLITATAPDDSNKGFSFIELMVVITIIAILAVMALPSYRRYVIANAERDAQAKMLQLQIQLESWRAKSLSYKGFKPAVIDSSNSTHATAYSYADTDNKIIYVPDGSTAIDYRYKITLVDGTSTTAASLVQATSITEVDSATGRTWRMLATPNPTGSVSRGHRMLLGSDGIQCRTVDSTIIITSKNCGISSQGW